MNKNKEVKVLRKKYNKIFKKLKKKSIKNVDNGLSYFVTYLKFLRDFFILTEPLEINGADNFKISDIATAIEEYYQYLSCENYYFANVEGVPQQIVEGTKEEVLKKYNEEKTYHWLCFWQLIADGIESWEGAHDTI